MRLWLSKVLSGAK